MSLTETSKGEAGRGYVGRREADITDRDGYRAGHEGPWHLSPS